MNSKQELLDAAVAAKHLSRRARLLLFLLIAVCDEPDWTLDATRNEMAALLGTSYLTWRRAKKELVEAGFLHVTYNTWDPNTPVLNNFYTLKVENLKHSLKTT